jgi:peptide/nickel transport system substrate-binding protein
LIPQEVLSVQQHIRRLAAAVGVSVLVLALVACGSTKKPTAAAETTGKTSDATFTYGTYTDVVTTLDPSISYSNEILAMQNMYETLTRYDAKTRTIDPLLATKYTSSKDGRTWTFTLRKGVTFHTGRALDAQAAKAALMRTITLKQGAAYIWDAVDSIDTPDASTLVFHLKYAAPLDLIASADYAAYIFDVKAAPEKQLTKWFNAAHDAGTGPYTLAKWAKGQEVEVRLNAFPKYWGGWDGPHYQRVVYRVIPQATTSAQLIRAGEIDYAARLTPQLRDSFKDDADVRVTSQTSFQNLLAMLNTQSGPLVDKTLRQAVAQGIDYDGIVAGLHGGGTRAHGLVPPGLLGHSDAITGYQTDVEQAKALLKSKGYGPGAKKLALTLTYTQGDSDMQLVTTLIKSNLAALNIAVDVRPLAWPTQWDKAKSADKSKRQDILIFYWWPDYADPYSWFINLVHTEKEPFFNLAYYSNPAIDKLIESAPSLTATDRDKAGAVYRQLQKRVLADAPVVPLYDQAYQRTLLKSVGGFVENPAYPNVVFAYDLQPTG